METDAPRAADCCVEEVGQVVQRLVGLMHLFERDQIKVFNLTASQCYTMLAVLKAGELTMQELSDRMNVDRSTMTRVVKLLVRDGYLNRTRSQDDGRVVTVSLTSQGEQTARELQASIEKYYVATINALPQGEISNVLAAATLLFNAFEKANPNCC